MQGGEIISWAANIEGVYPAGGVCKAHFSKSKSNPLIRTSNWKLGQCTVKLKEGKVIVLAMTLPFSDTCQSCPSCGNVLMDTAQFVVEPLVSGIVVVLQEGIGRGLKRGE